MSDLELRNYYDQSYPPDIYGGGPPIVPATGANAGAPGTWTPAGSTPPANAAAAGGIVANPATDWTVGQYVQGTDAGAAGQMNWNGTAWVAGISAVAAEAASTPTEPEPAPDPEPGTGTGTAGTKRKRAAS